MKNLLSFVLTLCSCFAFAQTNIGIGTNTPNANAILDIHSGNKGVLLPRMDSVARKAIPNIKGMLVYDSTYTSYYFNTGSSWQKISGAAAVGAVASGSNVGDMLYWDGATWNVAPVGKAGQYLQLNANKKPTWAGDAFPVITTSTPAGITDSSAKLGGNLVSSGLENSGDYKDFEKGVCWSTAPNPTPASFNYAADTGSIPGSFQYSVGSDYFYSSGRLLVNTTYYVRAFALNNAGIIFGNELSFKTLNGPVYKPVVIASSFPDNLSATVAVFSYNSVTNNGGAAVTARGMCWKTSPNPTTANSKTVDGTGEGNFKSTLTGLVPNTTYYCRAYATNSAGTAYSEEFVFTTPL